MSADQVACKIECAELLTKFGAAFDRRDSDELRALFAADGTLATPRLAGKEMPVNELKSFFAGRPAQIHERHLLTNVLVMPTGADTAHARAYALAYFYEKAGEPPYSMSKPGGASNWEVDCVRTDAGWRIQRFKVVLVLVAK